MAEQLIQIDFSETRTLRDQVREHLVSMILAGSLPLDIPLPSSRSMAAMLGVSRNTITQIYEDMVDMGFLMSLPRQGYFVTEAFHEPQSLCQVGDESLERPSVDWSAKLRIQPADTRNIIKPSNWSQFEYPFIYGQVQPALFPERHWRECARKALSVQQGKHWLYDWVDTDDPLLVEQLRSKILPRRGIYAESSQILITIGTQNSLYLLANLLMGKGTKVGMEDPGFTDARNIFSMFGAELSLYEVDKDGIDVDRALEQRLNEQDFLYLTPSHQVPTGAVLSAQRRKALLALADNQDLVLIEDDYDAEINLQVGAQPALKANDHQQRVIYIGSMSKSIAPGLRLGFMVADEELISEARALRRLMYRHVPIYNQRQLALFFSQGYYDTYLRKIRSVYGQKRALVDEAIQRHLPEFVTLPAGSGATSVWLKAPEAVDTERLSWQAAKNGILIEPGAIHFAGSSPPSNFFRLGFSAIDDDKIEPGIRLLRSVIDHY